MSNMSHCRFENTFRDLQDVNEHIWDNDLSESEAKFRGYLIELCQEIAADAGDDDSDE